MKKYKWFGEGMFTCPHCKKDVMVLRTMKAEKVTPMDNLDKAHYLMSQPVGGGKKKLKKKVLE